MGSYRHQRREYRLPNFLERDEAHAVLLAAKTIRMKAGPAIQALIECAVPVAPGPPDGRVRGTEQADHWHAQCRSHVHGPVVVTDHQRGPLQYRRQCLQACFPNETAKRRLHAVSNPTFEASLLIAAEEERLG